VSPTVAVLGSALALGLPALVFVLWPLRRRDRAGEAADPGPPDDARTELLAEKAIALRTLRELDLDHVAGHLADDDHAALRARAEADAAAILRRLEALPPPPIESTVAPPAPPASPSALPWTRQPAVLGVGAFAILAFGLVLGVLVTRFMAPAPPEIAMPVAPPLGPGGLPLAGAGGEAEPARPLPKEMLQGMLAAAHQSLDAGRYQEAIAAYKAVLRREPKNVEAITHLGVILGLAGHADGALEAFDRALAIDPGYAHAWWDKAGVLQDQKQDYAGAATAWERFLALAPDGPDRAQAEGRLREARQRAAAGARPPTPPRTPSP
jgi:tetratricopeptide (TPR) repeat protein